MSKPTNVNDVHVDASHWDDKVIGSGRFGNVFRGSLKTTGKSVLAVKAYSMKSDTHEFDMHRQLDHENVVKAYAAGIVSNGFLKGKYAIIMEYCSHGSLHELLQKYSTGLSDAYYIKLVHDLQNAIQHIHGKNIIHGDVKPRNILVTEDKVGGQVCFKLCDFLSANQWKRDINNPDSPKNEWKRDQYMMGTVLYWHPFKSEMFSNVNLKEDWKEKRLLDIWSIGLTLYEAATGKRAIQPKPKKDINNVIAKAHSAMETGVIRVEQKEDDKWAAFKELPNKTNEIAMTKELADQVEELLVKLLDQKSDESSVEAFYEYELTSEQKESSLNELFWFALNEKQPTVHDFDVNDEYKEERKKLDTNEAQRKKFDGYHIKSRMPVLMEVKNEEELKAKNNDSIIKEFVLGKATSGHLKGKEFSVFEISYVASLKKHIRDFCKKGLDDSSFVKLLECIRAAYVKGEVRLQDFLSHNILVTKNLRGQLAFELEDYGRMYAKADQDPRGQRRDCWEIIAKLLNEAVIGEVIPMLDQEIIGNNWTEPSERERINKAKWKQFENYSTGVVMSKELSVLVRPLIVDLAPETNLVKEDPNFDMFETLSNCIFNIYRHDISARDNSKSVAGNR